MLQSNRPWIPNYAPGTKPDLNAIPFRNIAEMIEFANRKYATQTAFTTVLPNGMSGSLTYAEVERMADEFATYLREVAGLKAGDRVAVQMPNHLSYPAIAFGTLKAGCVIVNMNPLYTAPEMHHQLKDSGARVIVMIDLFADKLTEALNGTAVEKVLITRITQNFPFLKATIVNTVQKYVKKTVPAITVDHEKFPDALSAGREILGEKALPLSRYCAEVGPDSIAALQYTGGTTGVSKGAALTHGNLMSNVFQVLQFVGDRLQPGTEVILTALPLYHIFAFMVNLLMFHYLGAHNVMVPSPRPMSNLKPALLNYPVTWITGVNTLFNALCNEAWFVENPPKAIKGAIAGGMALQKAVADRWEKVAHSPIIEGYGLTESSPVLTFNPLGGKIKSETIGIPMPSTDILCVDDNGKPVPVGQPGELIAKGPQVMKGYWKRDDETAKVLRDGWLYTGDIATMDEDGYFKIVDRKKDMILISGFNVYPNEIEDVLSRHPGVLEAAVIGIPNTECGEAVKAFIVKKDPSLTAEDIKEHCKKSLTAYKIPRVVEFRTELPKTPVGKILRKELRAQELSGKSPA